MAEEKKYTILIGAGGTGGHVFPAIALAKKFKFDGHKAVIIATDKKIKSIDEHPFPILFIIRIP